jgi:hypothetical protein
MRVENEPKLIISLSFFILAPQFSPGRFEVGDRVAALRVANGQKYYVLHKEGDGS